MTKWVKKKLRVVTNMSMGNAKLIKLIRRNFVTGFAPACLYRPFLLLALQR